MIKTVKFGGSSLASGGQFEKVKKIVTADSARKIVVVSAPGRRSSGDSKVTDLLYICHAHIKYKVSYEDILSQIKERYDEIISYCKLDISLDEDFEKIKKDIKWMQDQASTHGLLGHPALTQPIKNILLEEAKRENLAITLENGPDNTLTIHPVTAPLENVSRWLTTAQVTYGIVIEDLQFTLAGNEEITLRHLSFREQQ